MFAALRRKPFLACDDAGTSTMLTPPLNACTNACTTIDRQIPGVFSG
jgi:hypothetical protein